MLSRVWERKGLCDMTDKNDSRPETDGVPPSESLADPAPGKVAEGEMGDAPAVAAEVAEVRPSPQGRAAEEAAHMRAVLARASGLGRPPVPSPRRPALEWLVCFSVIQVVVGLFVMVCAMGAMSAYGGRFSAGYREPLHQAVVTTNPEVAFRDLQRAIRYAEANHLTTGNTSDPPRPETDLLAWHRQLIAASAKIATITSATPVEERRQVLDHVRRSLTDAAHNPRVPEDMSLYPGHLWYRPMFNFSIGLALCGLILFLIRLLLP